LAQLTPAANRGDIYAWYSLIGTAGAACGMVVSGWLMHYVREELKWGNIRTYRAVFWAYAVVGLIKLGLALALSKAVEAEKKQPPPVEDPETAPLLGDGAEDADCDTTVFGDDDEGSKKMQSVFRSMLPEISKESRIIVANLCILFALDAFASGLAPL